MTEEEMLIDSHCHLNFKAFKGKVGEVVDRAKKTGVEKIIVPGTKLDSGKKAVELAEKYDGVYATVGIHPVYAEKSLKSLKFKALRDKLEELAGNKKVVAVGECGLDYYQAKSSELKAQNYNLKLKTVQAQKDIFEMQIGLAKKLNLPLIIHNRRANRDVQAILYRCIDTSIQTRTKITLHCFQGNDELLNWAIKNNFYIGITGIVTYDNKMQQVVKKTPLKNLLVETDSPFLTPEPLRSQRIFPNTPANVKIVAEKVAKIKNISFEEVERQTAKNAIKLFNIG